MTAILPVTFAMTTDMLTVSRKTKYPLDAFAFVQRGLEFTVQRIHGQAAAAPDVETMTRHVTGRDLSIGLRDFAVDQYGLMARMVLRRWNILGTDDFGAIVFAMVEEGLMHKTQEDSLDDFSGVLDFENAFEYAIELNQSSEELKKSTETGKVTKNKQPKKK